MDGMLWANGGSVPSPESVSLVAETLLNSNLMPRLTHMTLQCVMLYSPRPVTPQGHGTQFNHSISTQLQHGRRNKNMIKLAIFYKLLWEPNELFANTVVNKT